MLAVPAGRFAMGEPKERVFFKEDGEGPVRQVRLSGFLLDRYEVSNEKFREFVAETGHVTEAERLGDSFVAEAFLSAEVSATVDKQVVEVPWWLPVRNATWRHPEGFDSGLTGSASRFGDRQFHPVVHVSWHDAVAYCRWRNATLPSEAQWEYAARAGLQVKLFPWGDDMQPLDGVYRMNIWQGQFPVVNTAEDGYSKTAPVDAYGAQNTWGFYHMVGNVWEWVEDWFSPFHYLTEETQRTGLVDPTGPTVDELDYLFEQGLVKKTGGAFEKVIKGGSFMCHKSYCYRYRIGSRTRLTPDTSAHHVGFRCARRAEFEAAS